MSERRFMDWAELDMSKYDTPVLGFKRKCMKWEQHAPKHPIRGRLFQGIAWLISWRTEQIFSSEFMESWEVRAETDLSRQTCTEWESRYKPNTATQITWGPATFPSKVTFGPASPDEEYVSSWAIQEDHAARETAWGRVERTDTPILDKLKEKHHAQP